MTTTAGKAAAPGGRAEASAAVRAALRGFDPSPEQWTAIAHPLIPVHLIAGAGSGKTAVMAARIVWAVEVNDYSPSEILGLTFTNKAADELAERVHVALAELPEVRAHDVAVHTYNAFAAAIVREHGLLIGVEQDAALLSEAQQWQLVLSCLDDLKPFDAIDLRSSGGVVRATLTLASSVSDHIASLEDIETEADRILAARGVSEDIILTARKRKELCDAVEAYQRAKKRTGRIDFGDQMTCAVGILEQFPDVRDAYRTRYPMVLLDEYQDTNVAQRRMIQALVGRGSITAVGDARQAIYAFRGATMYNLIGFSDDFPRKDGARYEPISLCENFRSGERILAAANHVVDRIDRARRPGAPLRAHGPNGNGKVELALFTDESTEADFIARQCARLHETAVAPKRPQVRWRDIAILVRRKKAMDELIAALDKHEVPVEVVGLSGLLRTPEVTEIVGWLRALDTKPSANRWLARILLGPRWRIHFRDLSLCARWASDQNYELRLKLASGDAEKARDMEPGDVGFALTESLSHLDEVEGLGSEARRRLGVFAAKLESLRRRAGLPLMDLVQHVIHESGVGDALESSPSKTAGAARQNLSNFLDQVAGFAPVEGDATLRTFLDYLDAAEEAEETLEAAQPADHDSVKLMTVHSAKGLEFECVFVPSVAATINRKGEAVYSIFPNTRASNPLKSYQELPYEVREDKEHLPQWEPGKRISEFSEEVKERVIEDERRLFYVALTRAKQHLCVTAAWWYGRDGREKGPSPFWSELEELVDGGVVDLVRKDENPGDNPVVAALEARRTWPQRARAGENDALFARGWGAAAEEVLADRGTLDRLLDPLPEDERAAAAELMGAHREDVGMLQAAAPAAPTDPEVPEFLSATAYVRWRAGELDAWDLMRPLPERPTPARRLGTEVHRLIEERMRGISPYPDETELDDPGVVETAASEDEARLPRLIEAWEALGYADRRIATLPSGEPMVEVPFTLQAGERIVRGRIDAVYESDDGGLEIVDFKTGKRFEPKEDDQLEIYARALSALGMLPAGQPVTLTYAFLDGEPPIRRRWDPGDGDKPN